MSSKQPTWTKDQLKAIEALGRDVLVTASAGTGKTAVLSRRCVNLLGSASVGVDVSRILVVTFTEAAADELRIRIFRELYREYVQTGDPHVHRQLLLLDSAQISTIHAFCKRVITEHFYKLELDPAFRIIDSDEQDLLKSEVLEETIERAWNDPELSARMNNLVRGRGVRSIREGLFENVTRIAGFLESLSDPKVWFERIEQAADAKNTAFGALVEAQKTIAVEQLDRCVQRLRYAQSLDQQLWPQRWSKTLEEQYIVPMQQCTELIQANQLPEGLACIDGFKVPTLRRPKGSDEEIAELIRGPAKKAVSKFKELKNLAIFDADYYVRVHGVAAEQTSTLLELVRRFEDDYAKAKRRAVCLDFADLQQLALQLLSEEEIAGKYREYFEYVFVDEFQDVNDLQQTIIRKLSRGDNAFYVGDIKQSIYAFRQANPGNFLSLLAAAKDDPKVAGEALRVDLGDNFRSRQQILAFANRVFERVMREPLSPLDYDERALLRAGFTYEPIQKQDRPIELTLLNEDSEEADSSEDIALDSVQRQAGFIAHRIREMVGMDMGKAQFQVFDKEAGAYRDVEFRDIVILMRSPANRARQYVEVLQCAGIPVSSSSSAGYFSTTEITDCLSLLKVLDNPRRDIELAAVLRSPFCGLTDMQLAMIRLHSGDFKDVEFHDCVLQYSKDGKDVSLRMKLQNVLAQLDTWRTLGRRGSIADLLWRIFRETGYLAFVAGLPNGPQRRANLLKLDDRAIQFENFATNAQVVSLARFVEFLDRLLEQGKDWASAEPEAGGENAVRIMSVHKSKGLEFPVVFLAQLNSQFNRQDTIGDCLYDADAMGLQIIDTQRAVKRTTLAHQVLAHRKLESMLAEEIRILYVAMTRARERLILVGSGKEKHCRQIVTACAIRPDEPLEPWQLRSAKCHLDWVLYGLGTSENVQSLFGISSQNEPVDDELFRATLFEKTQLDELAGRFMKPTRHKMKLPKKIDKTTMQTCRQIRESIEWQYSYTQATARQAKTSVTAYVHRDDDFARRNVSGAFTRKLFTETEAATSGRMLGSAYHLILEKLDLHAEVNEKSIRQTIQKLVDSGSFTQDVAHQIDVSSLAGFFESELGRQVLQSKTQVYREWSFTFAAPGQVDGVEPQIIQGILDLLIVDPDGITIVDFKSDRIDEGEVEERRVIYQQQVRLYAQAAKAILQKQVLKAWLYFLVPGIAVQVELD